MDIQIRYNFLHANRADIAAVAIIISLASFFNSSHSLSTYSPCSEVEVNCNSSYLTLPRGSSCCSSLWHTCLGWPISSNGTEIVKICISDKDRCHAQFSTIIMFISQLEVVRLIFTVHGNDHLRFLSVIRLLFIVAFPLALLPILWYDCYHRLIVCLGSFTWGGLVTFTVQLYVRTLSAQRQQRPDQNPVQVTRH